MEDSTDVTLHLSKDDHAFLVAVLKDSVREWGKMASDQDDEGNIWGSILPRKMSEDINKLIDKVTDHHKRKTDEPRETTEGT